MNIITITQTAATQLRAVAEDRGRNLIRHVRHHPDGSVDIEVDDEVYNALKIIDPDPSTAIDMLVRQPKGKN